MSSIIRCRSGVMAGSSVGVRQTDDAWRKMRVCGHTQCLAPGRGNPAGAAADFRARFGPREEPAMRAGLYTWVSSEGEPTLPRQHDTLRAYVAARGWTVVCQIEDIGSQAADHPHRAELMKLARCHALDV